MLKWLNGNPFNVDFCYKNLKNKQHALRFKILYRYIAQWNEIKQKNNKSGLKAAEIYIFLKVTMKLRKINTNNVGTIQKKYITCS